MVDREKLPALPRARGLFPNASIQGRLDELLHLVKTTGLLQREAMERQEALQRFAMSGESAPPMSSRQVAYVLNTTVDAVNILRSRGELARRFGYRGYHPDDVRAHLKHAGRALQEDKA